MAAMTFLHKMRRLRKEHRASYQKLADVIGAASKNTARRWFVEGTFPDFGEVVKLARHFQVPVEWLIDDDQDWPPPASNQNEVIQSALESLGIEEVISRLWLSPRARKALEANYGPLETRPVEGRHVGHSSPETKPLNNQPHSENQPKR